MNDTRRKEIREQLEIIASAIQILEVLKDEEQEYFDNMPEGIQESEKGVKAEETAGDMETRLEAMNEANDEIEELLNQ